MSWPHALHLPWLCQPGALGSLHSCLETCSDATELSPLWTARVPQQAWTSLCAIPVLSCCPLLSSVTPSPSMPLGLSLPSADPVATCCFQPLRHELLLRGYGQLLASPCSLLLMSAT